jgi:hypothetical protein
MLDKKAGGLPFINAPVIPPLSHVSQTNDDQPLAVLRRSVFERVHHPQIKPILRSELFEQIVEKCAALGGSQQAGDILNPCATRPLGKLRTARTWRGELCHRQANVQWD